MATFTKYITKGGRLSTTNVIGTPTDFVTALGFGGNWAGTIASDVSVNDDYATMSNVFQGTAVRHLSGQLPPNVYFGTARTYMFFDLSDLAIPSGEEITAIKLYYKQENGDSNTSNNYIVASEAFGEGVGSFSPSTPLDLNAGDINEANYNRNYVAEIDGVDYIKNINSEYLFSGLSNDLFAVDLSADAIADANANSYLNLCFINKTEGDALINEDPVNINTGFTSRASSIVFNDDYGASFTDIEDPAWGSVGTPRLEITTAATLTKPFKGKIYNFQYFTNRLSGEDMDHNFLSLRHRFSSSLS